MNAGFIFYKYYVISSMHLTEEPNNCPPMRAPALGAQCFSLRQKMTLPLFYIIHIIFEIGLFDCFTQAEALRSQCIRPCTWKRFPYIIPQ